MSIIDPTDPPEKISHEIEKNWLEYLRTNNESVSFEHTCLECGQKAALSGTAIRMAQSNNSRLNLPCGHSVAVPEP